MVLLQTAIPAVGKISPDCLNTTRKLSKIMQRDLFDMRWMGDVRRCNLVELTRGPVIGSKAHITLAQSASTFNQKQIHFLARGSGFFSSLGLFY